MAGIFVMVICIFRHKHESNAVTLTLNTKTIKLLTVKIVKIYTTKERICYNFINQYRIF